MKKIRMLGDRSLLIMMIVLAVADTTAMLLTMFVFAREETTKSLSDLIGIRIICGVLLVSTLAAIVVAAPRYLCTITLTETSIAVWVPFHKKETFSYKQFRNIYCGGYFHGNIAGVGRNIWYIVIAQRHLSSNELNQINLVSNSKEVVKIRYTRRIHEKLLEILPSGHVRQLESAVAKMRDK